MDYFLKTQSSIAPRKVKYRAARKLYAAERREVASFAGVGQIPTTSTNSFMHR